MEGEKHSSVVDRGPNTFTDWSEFQANPYHFSTVTQPSPPPRPIYEPDANNATYIDYDETFGEGTPKYDYYKRLDLYNQGLVHWSWVNEPYNQYLRNSHLIEAVAQQLGLKKWQHERARHRFLSLDLRKWGQRAELIASCVCAYTIHSDETDRTYHYNQAPENRDSLFTAVGESLGLEEREVKREYAKVENFFRQPEPGDPWRYRQFEEHSDPEDREGYINPSPYSLLENNNR